MNQSDTRPAVSLSNCSCGVKYVIVRGFTSSRKDNKRVYPVGSDRTDSCWFRCKGCHLPVHESVPGAEFDITDGAHDQQGGSNSHGG